MNEDLMLIKQLESLRAQHKQVDDRIDHEALDEFTRQRLKRERLHLREKISELERTVYPDIIA
jgi:hypothetical protein